MMNVSLELIAIVTLWVTTMGFLWNLHRDMGSLRKDVGKDMADLRQDVGKDMADLRKEFGRDTADLCERMARMEGLLKGFVARPQESQP